MWCEVITVITLGAVVLWGLKWVLSNYNFRTDVKGPYKNVVITGSTKGIGLALAKVFVRIGDRVIVCSRSEGNVNEALEQLKKQFPEKNSHYFGFVCDVTKDDSNFDLFEFAKSKLGSVDVWINNAGIIQVPRTALYKTPVDNLRQVLDTNLLGTMIGVKVAIEGMKKQSNGGLIFCMDGAGSSGMSTANFACYGASKAALPQFVKTINLELKQDPECKNIRVHLLSPGMVVTDLIKTGERNLKVFKIFNILCEAPHTVAEWLVPRIRGLKTSDGAKYIKFLTMLGVVFKFATFWMRRNRFWDEKTGKLKEQ